MSNVLIGIIGVILFIGLALAGALFLGSRFQAAASQAKAAAQVQAVQQLSQAISLRQTADGVRAQAGSDGSLTASLLSDGYLKVLPGNPVQPGQAYSIVAADGTFSGPAHMVIAGVSPSTGPDPTSEEVCRDIAPSTGRQDVSSLDEVRGGVACIYTSVQIGSIKAGRLFIVGRI